MQGRTDVQEEVEAPTGRVPRDIRADTPVEASPPVAGLDVLERRPYRASDPSLRLLCRYLELDLEEVERVHTQHRDDACTEPGERMVLGMERKDERVSATRRSAEGGRTMAAVGKKLG